MVFVGGYVWRTPSNRMAQFAEIEIIELSNWGTLKKTRDVLLALKFRVESDMQQNDIGLLGTAIFIDGPTCDGIPIQQSDVINQLATYVDDWSKFKPEWLGSTDSFVGCYVLSNDVRTKVSASHPLILPTISMCFGSFRGTYDRHLFLAEATTQSGADYDARKQALHSLSKHFGSFVAQAQRESARNYFGSFFAQQSS